MRRSIKDPSSNSKVVQFHKTPRPAAYDPLREIPRAALITGPTPPAEEGLRLMHAYFAIGEPAVRTALMEYAERLAEAHRRSRKKVDDD